MKRQKKRNKNAAKNYKNKAYQYIEDPSASLQPAKENGGQEDSASKEAAASSEARSESITTMTSEESGVFTGIISNLTDKGKNALYEAESVMAAEESAVTAEHITVQNKIQTEKIENMQKRHARIIRKTEETDIILDIELDGTGKAEVQTGIGFFDHMLKSFAKHGYFDLKLLVKGDLYVDSHHTIEDTGIALGDAIKQAIGDKKGIKRYGSVILPMDEALVLCSLDMSGRPYLVYQAEFTAEKAGYLDIEMVKEFFYAVSYSAGMNLHIKVMDGTNNHHIIEAMFKAFGKALDEALQYDPRNTGILSTKGIL